jgi:hypothetical protein
MNTPINFVTNELTQLFQRRGLKSEKLIDNDKNRGIVMTICKWPLQSGELTKEQRLG